MCSSVLGPAMPPPFVTWPTSSTAGPASLANRMSRAADSRTWPTFPGAPSSSSVYVVWIESTNTTRLPSARAWCSIASSRVSPSTWTAPASSVRRSARSRTWSGDSSPETYSVRMPACSRRAAHCSSRVDFPMPGSPPTSTTEPGTMPPPSTKSNSRRPVCHRSRRGPPPRADRRTGGLPDGETRFLSGRPLDRPTASSTSVFHAPQESQRPAHFGCSAPQSVQRNTECALATDRLGWRLARREVVEPRVFLLEVPLHGAGGPLHHLEVIHHDHTDVVLGLEASRLGAHRQGREHGGIVDPDRCGAEQAGGARQLGVVVVAQLAAPQPLGVHQALGAEQPLHQLLLRHLE